MPGVTGETTASSVLLFPPFRLDLRDERLWRDGEAIALRPKTFGVLRYLAEHPGRLATKDALLDAVWGDVAISETVLKSCVRELRDALGDDPRSPRFVETVHRRGYRFIAPLRSEWSGAAKASIPSTVVSFRSLVGRATELAELESAFHQAVGGERRIVFVTGEPGIGKTALVEAFLVRVAAEDVWVGYGQCVDQYGSGEAYMPILEAFGRLCRGPGGERLRNLLDRHAPTWLAEMPALLDTTALEALQRRAAGATRERMLREMAEALEVVTAERPLVLWLEDLHWSDASTLGLLAMLGRRQEPARLLVIGSYRPVDVIVRGHALREVKQELALHARCHELPLRLLSEEAVEEFLTVRFEIGEDAGPLRELARAIHERTEGNPLFMVNVVGDLVERGGLARVDGRWAVQGAVGDVAAAVPATLRQMIEWQVDRRSDEDRRLLEVASVAGNEFSTAALAAAVGTSLDTVEERCANLAREHFLHTRGSEEWSDGSLATRYGFAHALYEEVLYQRLAPNRRVQLHLRIAEWLEGAYGARTEDIAGKLAMHFERGRDCLRAARHLTDAAAVAVRRVAYQPTIDHSMKALALLESVPECAESRVLGLTARSYVVSLGWSVGIDEATEVRLVAEARDLATRGGDPRALIRLLTSHAASRAFVGDMEGYRTSIDEADRLERALPDRALRVLVVLCSAPGYHWTGDMRGLARVANEAYELLRFDPQAVGDIYMHVPSAAALMHRSRADHYAGRLAAAERGYRLALDEARAVSALAEEAELSSELAWLDAFRGDVDAAFEHASRAMEIASMLDNALVTNYASRGFLLATATAGRWEEAAAGFEAGAAAMRETGAWLSLSAWPLSDLCGIYLASGDAQRARTTAEEAIAMAERFGSGLPNVEAHVVLPRALVRCEGAAARAEIERVLARAAILIEQTGAFSRQPLVHVGRAELARALGDEATWRRELGIAQRLFEEMSAPLRAAQVARDLEA